MLAVGPKVRGFKPSRGDGFLMAMKNRSTIFFREEAKPSVPCLKILHHADMKRYFLGKIHLHFRYVPPASLPDISSGYCQRALMDESGMIRTEMGTHNRSEYGRSAWHALCDTIP
jgi:hypothetical protein